MKRAASVGLLAILALAGCASGGGGRDRIVRAPKPCRDVTAPIYFEPNATQIPEDARRLIAAEARVAKRCRVEEVRVVGLADAAGDPAANLALSKARAAAVADMLVKAGLPPAQFDVAAAGQAGALTPDGATQPVRRRVEITLKLTPP